MPRYRAGRRNPHAIYTQTGDAPSDDDPFIGSGVTPAAVGLLVGHANNGLDCDELLTQLQDREGELRAERDLYSGLMEDSERGRRSLVRAAQALLNDIDANITGSVSDYLADATSRLRRLIGATSEEAG